MATNLYNTIYNPDVLSCIANLSNDEVFTPPEVANAMLDLLPQELFRDPATTFLDPACKRAWSPSSRTCRSGRSTSSKSSFSALPSQS